eukprot:CAMPEP_0172192898 /NCGR_PEP_ID=MMETSP1050-20130122/24622_1 /TAXON_ID=233186 /ORGANISM="Cryptomonas curvata, Strain CCAP979/52" /LENGTH=138 /DNA_ID=CAMNT_0012868329 /DNA_START=90 /DNA_END=502 /DNA_ORIENTATION=+
MAHTPNVHIEHLPAGRYGARPNHESGPEIGLSKDDLGGHLQHPKLTHSDHHLMNPHGYHSVAQGVYNTEIFSYSVCAMFAVLAVAQLVISGWMMLRWAPELGEMYGSTGLRWARRKGQLVAALVPCSAVRMFALLLLA